jgi:hypothetical protein
MRATVGTILATGLLLLAGCSSSSSGNNQNQNPGVTATWTGTVSSPGTTSAGVQFALAESNGQLTGQMFLQDPVTNEFLPDDAITGTRNGSNATWQTGTNLLVKGKFDQDGGFTGTLEYPADYPLAIHVVDLALHR